MSAGSAADFVLAVVFAAGLILAFGALVRLGAAIDAARDPHDVRGER